MRLVPTEGIFWDDDADKRCPPIPFFEIEDAEAESLLMRGLAKVYVEGSAAVAVPTLELNNPDATPAGVVVAEAPPATAAPEQASVGAEGAASGEAAPAAASEATSADGGGPETEAEVEDDDGSLDPHGAAPADTPEENAKLQDVADHIELLTADDFVKTGPRTGRPKVSPLAAALGRDDLTAEEVDAAFALHEAKSAS